MINCRQDEDIFQLSRNINVGFFATVVLKDYVAAILNTPRANSYWSLDLGGEIKTAGSRVERATGNVVSVEFAVLYHWHAALSAADGKWMEDLLKWNLPDLKSLDDMTPELFGKVLAQEGGKLFATDANKWTFNGLKRGEDGRFNDIELAELIKKSNHVVAYTGAGISISSLSFSFSSPSQSFFPLPLFFISLASSLFQTSHYLQKSWPPDSC